MFRAIVTHRIYNPPAIIALRFAACAPALVSQDRLKVKAMLDQFTLNALARHFPFVGAADSGLRLRLQSDALPIDAPAGRIMFDCGDHCLGMGLLTEGCVCVTLPLTNGRRITLYRVEPGQACILSAGCMLSGQSNMGRSMVERDIRGALLPKDLFLYMIDGSRHFRMFIFQAFTNRMGDIMKLVEELATQNLDQRLAALLLSMPSPMKTTHQALADHLGSVREVVTRVLNDFERDGWIKVKRAHIEILRPDLLKKMALEA